MRLSESLQRNVLESSAGRLFNKFKLKGRRNVLFFEDILSEYIRECERQNKGKELEEAGQKWMNLVMKLLIPSVFDKLPLFFLNNIMKKVWINVGLLEDIRVTKKGNIVTVNTVNERITKKIGENSFLPSLYEGILNIVFDSKVTLLDKKQRKGSNRYRFSITDCGFGVDSKKKEEYDRLNFSKRSGLCLKDALKGGILQLDSHNRINFRGGIMHPMENSLFHILGDKGIMLDRLPNISYEFFSKIIDEKSSNESRLGLIKTILQVSGWGIVRIVVNDRITFKIENPPYGLQAEEDNWDFIKGVILGYLWTIDKRLEVSSSSVDGKILSITYSRH